ncbi:hypothetical protein J7K03_02610 [bacterium]|nr:hypothetical protein [bacterium]
MRAETELIQKIKELKGIEPRKEWVFFTKREIFGEKWFVPRVFESIFSYKYALSSLIAILLIGGIFVSAQHALPGDLLYPVKRAAQKARLVLAPEEQLPNIQLEYANEKLEDLVKVAKEKKVEKLAPLIEEYQANISEAAKTLKEIKQPDVKEIVEKTKKLEENKEKVKSLGVIIEEPKELDNALASLVKSQIQEIEKSSLSREQEKIFEQVKEDYKEGKYSQALEKILILSYPQEK